MPIPKLAELLPAGAVSTDPDDLRAHARDWWSLAMLRERRGDPLVEPVAVVRPASAEEVATVLRWADETRTPVVPFGGGSSVVGGAQAVPGAIALDLGRLDRVLEVDRASMSVRTQAGVFGPALEEAAAREGLTVGHFPQSFEISTVGGWLSARGAGQKSSRYGRAEDLVLGIEAVLASGRIVRTPVQPATSAGPDLAALFVGAEGTLGVITEATLRARPLPRRVAHGTYAFADFAAGLAAVRAVAQADLHPAVMRLYDENDVQIAFRTLEDRPDGPVAVLRFEGDALGEAEERAIRDALEGAGGKDLGAAIAEWWWEHRNGAVETYRKIMLEGMLGQTAVVDTMEVAARWPDVPALYEGVRNALGRHADAVGCHASHVYPEGSCLYFTFVMLGPPDDGAAEQQYRAAWEAGMEATLAAGGTVSHHHGVGLLKAPWAAREWGEGIEVLRAIKRALDPNGIMNPGKLGL